MDTSVNFRLPPGFDWEYWVERWDRMQDRYLVRRAERFAIMARLIHETHESAPRVLDLGCGAGSSMVALLERLPQARVFGIDFDPTILCLAEKRLARFGERARAILADVRTTSWTESLPLPVDAVVSATALHWLSADELAALYTQIARALRPGGIFINADHVASDYPPIQAAWERHREAMRSAQPNTEADDWDGFWNAYAHALNMDIKGTRESAIGEPRGVERGLPLAWHFDQLRASGFSSVDCFWRCDCDAIYGGVL